MRIWTAQVMTQERMGAEEFRAHPVMRSFEEN
jgi:hypothetical protein